ncbi:MAG: hypothetical protein K0R17_2729 [Rariglobus sp.]|jgi:hypothetical protein|nr:hypothetical protein [Rariglobus sp.]
MNPSSRSRRRVLASARHALLILGSLALGAATQAQTPLIFTHTKAALPGDTLTLHGAYFVQGANQPQVWFDQITGSTDTPNAETQAATVVSASENLLHARVPATLPKGLYAVFVKCGAFTSAHVWVNRAEAWQTLDLAGSKINPGRAFRLYGWSLDLPGATPQVWFENTATLARTAATVTNLDRANFLTLTAPASLAAGQTYRLIVNNGHGGTYGETTGPVLACVATPADPLNLGVPWAGEYAFATSNVYNVKTDTRLALHAVGDGVADDSAAIQAACDAASAAGGGQVYFPAGTYNLGATVLRPGKKVVLKGAGMNASTLVGTINPKTVHSTLGTVYHMGFIDLALTGGQIRFNSGSPDGGPVVFVRARIDTTGGAGLDVGGVKVGTLVKDSEIIARATTGKYVFVSAGTENLLMKNCYVQWSDGRLWAGAGRNLQIDDNTFARTVATDDSAPYEYGGWALDRSSQVAFIDNIFEKIGSGPIPQANDGETILDQAPPKLGGGHVTGATATTFTDSARAWAANELPAAGAHVFILDGPGEGQVRKIVSNTATTATLDAAWSITPTTASTYAVTWLGSQWLIAGNLFQNCPRTVWFYSSSNADVAVIDNTFINSGDIYIRSDQRLNDGHGRFSLFRNVLVQGNEMLNTDHVYPSQIIAHAVAAIAGETRLGNGFWDVAFRGNSIDSIRPSLTNNNGHGLNGEGYFSIGLGAGVVGGTEGAKGVLFDRNAARDLDFGFTLGSGAYQTAIFKPELSNVGTAWQNLTLSGASQAALNTVYVAPPATALIVDNSAATGVTITGAWTSSAADPGYHGTNYLHDGDAGKGTKSVRFSPTLATAGTYEVYLRWTASTSRANNVPVTITHAGGTASTQVNQKVNGGEWVLLGSYAFNAGTAGNVLVSTTGTSGYVVADAIKFEKQ